MTWLTYCKDLKDKYPVIPATSRGEFVDPYRLVDELSRLCKPTDVIAPGMSSIAACIVWQAWRVKQGQRFTYAGALGAMGTGVPAAIGAAIATGRRVICLNGDGGFMLNVQELEVVRRLQLPIKYFVLTNGGYGAIMNTQRAYFNGHFVGSNEESGLTLPDVHKLSYGFGIHYSRIEKTAYLKETLHRILADDKPHITEVMISRDFKFLHRVGTKMVDGKPTSMDFGEVE